MRQVLNAITGELYDEPDEVSPDPPVIVQRRLLDKVQLLEWIESKGKTAAAEALLAQVKPIVRQRWYAKTRIFADDPDLLLSLSTLGLDIAEFLNR